MTRLFVLALVTIGTTLWSGGLSAQEVGQSKELSPGRVRVNLGEGPANVPGYEKMRMVEDTAQPGATWKNLPKGMPYPMFCTLLKGEITTTAVDGGQVKRKAGESWVCHTGDRPNATNKTGSEPSVMRMHQLLKPGDK